MSATKPFSPGTTQTISASTTSAVTSSAIAGNAVRIVNATASLAFVNFTTAAGTATNAHTPVPSGVVEVLSIPAGAYVAVILAAGTGSVYVTSGDGI
jgi:hypothetical protein